MSTRAMICKICGDGYIKGIYCHFDGYFNHVGTILLNYYNTNELVDALLELGDLSTISTTIEDCYAYHRDGGEELHIGRFATKRGASKEEYNYFWENGEWVYNRR